MTDPVHRQAGGGREGPVELHEVPAVLLLLPAVLRRREEEEEQDRLGGGRAYEHGRGGQVAPAVGPVKPTGRTYVLLD